MPETTAAPKSSRFKPPRRGRRRQDALPISIGLALAMFAGTALIGTLRPVASAPDAASALAAADRRRLAFGLDAESLVIEDINTLPACDFDAKSNFPDDLFTAEQRSSGAIIIHIVVMCYMFVGIAVVCDEYFEPTLSRICEVLELESDGAPQSLARVHPAATSVRPTVPPPSRSRHAPRRAWRPPV